ncbi:MAG: response regulator [Eubacteriales bacterium]
MDLRTILYVDDSPLDVELTIEVLKDNNIINPIAVTNDGVEALEYLRCEGKYRERTSGNPGMILLDLKMPRMDGLEFLDIVKKDVKFKKIPVIMLTSSREEKDLIKGYDLGVNAYVVKPVDFVSFAEVVKEIGIFWAIINELPAGKG